MTQDDKDVLRAASILSFGLIVGVAMAIGFIHFDEYFSPVCGYLNNCPAPQPIFGGAVLTPMPLDWNERTILYPQLYCKGGSDGPYFHDWGLCSTVTLENYDGQIASSTEWLSPEAISDALSSQPTGTCPVGENPDSNGQCPAISGAPIRMDASQVQIWSCPTTDVA
jgi:hypothetical protein